MRDKTDLDAIADLQLVEFDSNYGAVPTLEQHDVHSTRQALYDDLVEIPQAFAAYLDYQQNHGS